MAKLKSKKSSKLKGLSNFGILGTINLYSRLYTAWRTKGYFLKPERGQLGNDEIFYSVNRVYTNNGVKKPYFIDEFPPVVRKGLITDLRRSINREVSNFNSERGADEFCKVNFVTVGENFKLDFSDSRIKGRVRHWSRQEARMKNSLKDNQTLEDELTSDKYSEGTKRMVKSYRLMRELKNQNASFFKSQFIVELHASTDDVLEIAEKTLEDWRFNVSDKLRVKTLFYQANEYYTSFSPLGDRKTAKSSLLKKMFLGDVLPDETINSLSVLTQGGTIGDDMGVIHGMDVLSREPFAMDVGNNKGAQNILVTAQTGQGKSVFVKSALGYYDLMGFRTITLDYEGDEYDYMGGLLDAQRISVSGTNTKYVNTLSIGRLTGDEAIDKELKLEAINMTERVFDILMMDNMNPDGMNIREKALFDELVRQVYMDAGVRDEDPNTWYKSERVTFYTVYVKLLDIKDNQTQVVEMFGKESVSRMELSLSRYFEPHGSLNHYFRNPISVDELLETDHLIFSFGMKGKDEGDGIDKGLALRQLFVNYLTMLKANYNKSKGYKTVLFLEELQRYLLHPSSGGVVANFASGGRKRGLVCYFITNSPSQLMGLRNSSNNNVSVHVKTIISSLTTLFIGALSSEDMELLVEEFSLDDARGNLRRLVDVAQQNNGMSPLKNCFFVRYKGQSTFIKAVCHPELLELPLFQTDSKQKVDDEYEERLKYGITEQDEYIQGMTNYSGFENKHFKDASEYQKEIEV